LTAQSVSVAPERTSPSLSPLARERSSSSSGWLCVGRGRECDPRTRARTRGSHLGANTNRLGGLAAGPRKKGSALLSVTAQLNIGDPYKREPYHTLGVVHDVE
jgi:hypothetical protein